MIMKSLSQYIQENLKDETYESDDEMKESMERFMGRKSKEIEN